MKKIILLIYCSFVLLHKTVEAQNCDMTAIMNTKGKWISSPDNIVFPDKTFPSSQYSQLRTRLDKIAALFREAYPQPMGLQATGYRSIRGSSLVEKGPVPYQFNSLYMSWYCNQTKHTMELLGETGTWSYVYVNDFGWLMTHQYDELPDKIEGRTAFLMPKKIGEWKGLALYEPTASPGKNKAVLISRDEQLPYKPVTRLQFLKYWKERLEKNKKAQLDLDNKMPERTETEQAAAKQKGLENALIGAPASRIQERTDSYLKRYRTDRQLKEEQMQRTEKFYNDLIKPLDDIVNNFSEEALQQPAIINTFDPYSTFKGFLTQEAGGRMIVTVNNDYFNLKLPRYVPQFLVLYWEWDKNPAAQDFKNHLEENFPVDKLKDLLDK